MQEKPQTSSGPGERIDMRKSADVDHWTRKLGVSREELAKAIESAGDRAQDVARYLAEHGPPATTE
jgi:hypothetical protein